MTQIWKQLFPASQISKLESFFEEIEKTANSIKYPDHQPGWYRNAVVYSLYVDLFNRDFNGLREKLPYLRELGVNCLWLLPVLDSPMKDAGFDVRNYRKMRSELLGLHENATDDEARNVFSTFVADAHNNGIKVIFDIAINHTSEEHPWFQESRKGTENPYRDFYIWNRDDKKYSETRLLFKGMCPSNWEKDGEWYFFHRFFEFQPDLNYRNPDVLLEMTRNFLFWLEAGVDGFRADAIPYLWKEEGTNCENLPETHQIIRFFRAAIDFVRPDTLLLAEACQPPKEVVKYFDSGDECHAGYHFPIMPQIFKAIAAESSAPVIETLSPVVTPDANGGQWFMFLRCHDELTLEMVTPDDREFIHTNYCHKPEWDFRVGEGISARLSELMKFDADKVMLAYSIMLTLPGTPVIYYGDEFGKANDVGYYSEMKEMTGKNDTRYFVRGKVDWDSVRSTLNDPDTFGAQIYNRLKTMINTRNSNPCFGSGEMIPLGFPENPSILAYTRIFGDERVIVVQNLSGSTIDLKLPLEKTSEFDLLKQHMRVSDNTIILKPYGFFWSKV